MNQARYTSSNFQAHYTSSKDINGLMCELLGDTTDKKILEPCIGSGEFIKGLKGSPRIVHGFDVDTAHFNELHCNFSRFLELEKLDFIDTCLFESLFTRTIEKGGYDALICNPPYGLKFSKEYRKEIKKALPNFYARESFGLFMLLGIECLRENGRFVFIVPDTFFTSRNHTALRKFLASSTRITEIIQFDSNRFDGINFGYGGLCIIAGNYRKPDDDKITWVNAKDISGDLRDIFAKNRYSYPSYILQDTAGDGWVHPEIYQQLSTPKESVLLGDIAECRTGIYSGNNSRFFGFDDLRPPARANGHPINWESNVVKRELTHEEKQNGINSAEVYVPLVRGGHRSPFEKTQHAINWSKDSVKYYRMDKKARLQNHSYYFRKGLAIPMVTSGRLTASYMEHSIFDQGVVGVFPKVEEHIPFILIYLNSEQATEYKSVINPTANNSANYLKRIVLPKPTKSAIHDSISIVQYAKINGWDTTESERKKMLQGLFR